MKQARPPLFHLKRSRSPEGSALCLVGRRERYVCIEKQAPAQLPVFDPGEAVMRRYVRQTQCLEGIGGPHA